MNQNSKGRRISIRAALERRKTGVSFSAAFDEQG
jgi:hypothetical protein